jgi:protein TonB
MSATTMNRRRYPGTEPSRRLTGWAVVVLLHVVILWALVSGTARKGLEIIKKPLEAAVIQEVIIPPPPPPPPPPPKQIVKTPEPIAPKVQAPPPPFVPPPDVAPAVTAPSIASVATPPLAPPVIAPPAPPAPPEPKPAGPARSEMGIACPTQVKPEMPRKALQDGTEGVVKAQALIRDGAVKEVTILSGPRVFHAAVRAAMLQYKCAVQPGDVLAPQEFVFKVDN